MVFNDTSTLDGLIQRCETLCNFGIGGITGDATNLKLFTSYINAGMRKVASALMKVDKRWTFDDYNYTDLPRGTATLVALQQDYTLPAATAGGNAATLLGIQKITVLNVNSPIPIEIPLQLSDWTEGQLNNRFRSDTPGLPSYYKLVGNSIKMWPRPSSTYCTMTNGLVVYFKRTPVPFATSGTDAVEPGFMSTHHELLAYYASALYYMALDRQKYLDNLAAFTAEVEALQVDYTDMNEDNENRIIPVKRNPR